MEDTVKAEASLELGSSEVLESAGTLAQEQVVMLGGMLSALGPEFARNGEGGQEVIESGQEACFLAGAPSSLVEGPILRA